MIKDEKPCRDPGSALASHQRGSSCCLRADQASALHGDHGDHDISW